METIFIILMIVLIVTGLILANLLFFIYIGLRGINKKFETLFEAFVNIGNGMGILNTNIIEMLRTCNYCTLYSNTLSKDEKVN